MQLVEGPVNLEVDLSVLESKLERGVRLDITYRYPLKGCSGEVYRTRTDRLLAVEQRSGRIFVNFKGEKAVWIERDEILHVEP